MKPNNYEFITRYQDDVLRYCFFLTRNEAAAKDLAQETFLKALASSATIKEPKAFLFQIAKNQFIDTHRKLATRSTYIDESLINESSIDPIDLSVWQTLFTLSNEDQEILLLVDREQMSLNEAAEFLKISESAAKSRLFRARENFKKIWNV